MRNTKKCNQIVVNFLKILIILISLSPLLFLVANSLKTTHDYLFSPFSFPETYTLDNYYNYIIHFHGLQYWLNTLLVVTVAISFSLLIGSFCAFSLSLQSKSKAIPAIFIITSLFFLPDVIFIAPLYKVFASIGATKGSLAIILMYIRASFPPTVIFLYISMVKISPDLYWSYMLDGASIYMIFFTQIPKICSFEICFIVLYNSLSLFKDYTMALLFISSNSLITANVAIARYLSMNNLDFPKYFAATVTNLLPFFIYFLVMPAFFRKNEWNLL